MSTLDGTVVLITGAGSGMGRTHATVMAARGARVVVNDIDATAARETAALVANAGEEAVVAAADISEPQQVDAMARAAMTAYGRVDVLVNNAGIGQHLGLEEIDATSLDRMYRVHVRGAFLCTRALVPGMKSRGQGKIINISSIWGMTGASTASHYCAMKAALLGATKAWARELAPWNIQVNAVAPGGVLTPMPIKVQGMEKIREKEKKVPLGRWARPEEISFTVAFLASNEADFITGQVISPNGGETIVGY
jgi:3-oxoacyl-[acyl-carrier protein] reductase